MGYYFTFIEPVVSRLLAAIILVVRNIGTGMRCDSRSACITQPDGDACYLCRLGGGLGPHPAVRALQFLYDLSHSCNQVHLLAVQRRDPLVNSAKLGLLVY